MKRFVLLTLAILLVLTVGLAGCERLIPKKTPPATTQVPVAPPPPPRPDIKVTAVLPQTTVTWGDIFDMIIIVNNYGQGAANNALLYGRAIPSGYLEILACVPSPTPVAPAGFKFNLGDLYPNGRVDVRMTIRAPRQYQAGNIPGMNIGVNFAYTYFYQNVQTAEVPAGELVFSLSQSGGIMFFKVGQ
jgi:hypothetical protein